MPPKKPICKCGICDECRRKKRIAELTKLKKTITTCPGDHLHRDMRNLKDRNPEAFKRAYRTITSVIEKVNGGPFEMTCDVCDETFLFYIVTWQFSSEDWGWGPGRTMVESDNINQKELIALFAKEKSEFEIRIGCLERGAALFPAPKNFVLRPTEENVMPHSNFGGDIAHSENGESAKKKRNRGGGQRKRQKKRNEEEAQSRTGDGVEPMLNEQQQQQNANEEGEGEETFANPLPKTRALDEQSTASSTFSSKQRRTKEWQKKQWYKKKEEMAAAKKKKMEREKKKLEKLIGLEKLMGREMAGTSTLGDGQGTSQNGDAAENGPGPNGILEAHMNRARVRMVRDEMVHRALQQQIEHQHQYLLQQQQREQAARQQHIREQLDEADQLHEQILEAENDENQDPAEQQQHQQRQIMQQQLYERNVRLQLRESRRFSSGAASSLVVPPAQLYWERECLICTELPANFYNRGCGHVCLCSACAVNCVLHKIATCILCRAPVNGIYAFVR
ncbi:hypothetical protein niasHT_005563 [Heterodera trifolii]|uniref:RING-type domain-containing protein n=1 Tax=Heterodera trifolii TaxID=157864 RepID=A0ABD2LRF7_9BILA